VLLRIVRESRVTGETAILLSAAGCTLAITRSFGPFLLALVGLVWILYVGRQGTAAIIRTSTKQVVTALVLMVVAASANIGWQIAVAPHLVVNLGSDIAVFWSSIGLFVTSARDQVGIFGWVDTVMPSWCYTLWVAMLLSLVFGAMAVTRGRICYALGLCLLLNILLPALFFAFIGNPAGGEFQGRWLLPFGIGLPILSAEVLASNQKALLLFGRRSIIGCVVIAVAVVQFAGWWQNSRRYAVGSDGPVLFFPNAQWAPPLGWGPWIGVMFIAAALLASLAFDHTKLQGGMRPLQNDLL
jgi:hypothetical protein